MVHLFDEGNEGRNLVISALLFSAPPSPETLIGAALIIIPNILIMTRPKKLAYG